MRSNERSVNSTSAEQPGRLRISGRPMKMHSRATASPRPKKDTRRNESSSKAFYKTGPTCLDAAVLHKKIKTIKKKKKSEKLQQLAKKVHKDLAPPILSSTLMQREMEPQFLRCCKSEAP